MTKRCLFSSGPLLIALLFLCHSCKEPNQGQQASGKPSPADRDIAEEIASAPFRPSPEFNRAEEFVNRYLSAPSPEDRQRLKAKYSAHVEFAKLNADELVRILETFNLTEDFNDPVVSSAMRQLAKTNFAGFISMLSKYGQCNWLAGSEEIARTLIANDAKAASKWLTTGEIGGRQSPTYHLAAALLAVTTENDYSKQADILTKRSESAGSLLYDTYSMWAKSDPEGAISHAATHTSGEDQITSIATILSRTSLTDPVKAYHLANEVGFHLDDVALSGFFDSISKVDSGEALSILAGLPADRIQVALSRPGATERIASSDPDAAIVAVSKVAFTKSSEPLYMRLVDTLSSQDPRLAREWVNGFPDGPSKQKMLDHIDAGVRKNVEN